MPNRYGSGKLATRGKGISKQGQMRILFTNIDLAEQTGTVTATLDLAVALRRRGHAVTCFSPRLGRAGVRIRATGTPVVDTIERIGESPDVIHGHHSGPAMVALTRFPNVPAIFVCHDWSSVYDDPPIHPRIRRYGYVRHVLRERLVSEKGIPPERVVFLANAIDLDRVGLPRTPPARILSAGVYAHFGQASALDALAEGCRRHGITFVGEMLADVHSRKHPEGTLANCDLVFARGRMAIEALAAGCAVINADRFGIGGLVTAGRFDEFVAANFAFGALSTPASADLVAETIATYDAGDAGRVAQRVRADCDVRVAAERLEQIYATMREEAAREPVSAEAEALALARYLQDHLRAGELYNREFQRTAIAGDALTQTIETLSSDVRELARQMRRRRWISRAFSDGWRAVLDFVRR